jgi:DNA replication protein DnaC
MPERLRSCGVPLRYQNCTFSNFNAYSAELRTKVDLLSGIAKSELKRGVFLFGSVGTGKTHLAASILGEQLLLRRQGWFVRGIAFASRCRESFRAEESVAGIVSELLDRDLLVFDDLGAEKTSDFVRESLLHLFDEAYCNGRPVVITSNLTIAQISTSEPRLASRITEMCALFKMTGEDYRFRVANSLDPAIPKAGSKTIN